MPEGMRHSFRLEASTRTHAGVVVDGGDRDHDVLEQTSAESSLSIPRHQDCV